jgi:hypothetical protein
LVASPLKNKQAMPELLEIGKEFPVDWKCVRREQPLFLGEKTLFGKRCTDCGQPLVVNLRFHYEANVQRPTLNVQHSISLSS